MQTQRLSSLSSPTHTELLIESCARELGLLPEQARHVREAWRLPRDLLEAALRAERDGEVWSSWTDGQDAWLLVGHLAIESARERGQPVLEIQCYDGQHPGRRSLIATRTPDGSWRACGG